MQKKPLVSAVSTLYVSAAGFSFISSGTCLWVQEYLLFTSLKYTREVITLLMCTLNFIY